MTSRRTRIFQRLKDTFDPASVTVEDESRLHAGHAGASPEGETHFFVSVRTPAFSGMSRVAMHRAVNAALSDEFDAGLHALRLDVGVPTR